MASGNVVRIRAILDDKVSGGLSKINDKFTALGKSKGAMSILQGVGVGAGVGAFSLLGSAASMAADFIGESITAASNMSETLSKSNVVFGTSAKSVEAFGNTAAKSMGMSKQAAIEATATLGNLFLGIGQSSAASADLSTKMVALAGDLASFNNIGTDVALEKLRSGLTGEAEPLRSLGVFLSEAKVKAQAMEMGLGDAHGELTEGEKILARYQVIMKETTTAQGDFARTADGLANSQRTVNAELLDAQARLGEQFQPIALQATQLQLSVVENVDLIAAAIEGLTFRSGAATQGLVADFGKTEAKVSTLAGKMADDVLAGSGKMKDDMLPAVTAIKTVGTAFETIKMTARVATGSVADDYEAMVGRVVDATTEGIDDALDPLALKYETLGDIAELTAARTAEATGTRTTAEKAASLEAVRALGEDLATMKARGMEGSAAYKKGMAALKSYAKSSSGETRTAVQGVIDKLNEVKTVGKSIPINFKLNADGNFVNNGKVYLAKGGPVTAGQPYVVGEEGPELFIPSGSGDMIANNKLTSGGGSPLGGSTIVHTTINLDGRVLARVVDEHLFSSFQRAAPTAGRV